MEAVNKHILLGIGILAGISAIAVVYSRFFAYVVGTSLTKPKLRAAVLNEKQKEDQNFAKLHSDTPANFDSAPDWWKLQMFKEAKLLAVTIMAFPSTSSAAALTPAQWSNLQAAIPEAQRRMTSGYDFTTLIHTYPDSLKDWLNQIPEVNDKKKAFDWILKNM